LLFSDRNDYPACHNQRRAEKSESRRFFPEGEPGHRLGDKEKNPNIGAQGPAKLPRWRINNVAVGGQDQAAGNEEKGALRHHPAVDA
jgi:hypothetical protein